MTSDVGSPAPLEFRDFEGRIGTRFEIPFEGGTQELELIEAGELARSPRAEGGFRLGFLGPLAPRFPQGIQVFRIDGVAHDIFIAPVGARTDGLLYEAIFF